MKKTIITRVGSLVLAMALLFPFSAFAEFYGGIMGGYAMPNKYTDRTNTVNGVEFSEADAPLENSFMVGGKVGYYLPNLRWLGFETEVFYTNPGFSLWDEDGQERIDGDMDVITWAQNVVVRYPGQRFQPYAGVGVGIFFTDVDYDQYSWDGGDITPGLNMLAGLRVLLTEHIALFGEYKYIYTRMSNDYDEIDGESIEAKGDYSSNIVAVGLSYHF